MKILVLKEYKSRKPDLMNCAVTEAFSLSGDMVTIATIKVGGILKMVTTIKDLIKQYKPDVVVAQKLLASITLFESPKTIKKIVIDPYLLFEDEREAVILAMIMKYEGSIRMNNWLGNNSKKLIKCPQAFGIDNSFCILHSHSADRRLAELFAETSNLVLVGKSKNAIDTISTYHRAFNKARAYLDPDFDLPNAEELLKNN